MTLDRRPLRDFIVEDILKRLQAGLLPVGSRVDEMALATELEVSRTPVREALSLLAYEGIFEIRVGKGFWVAPLEARDIEESYPIIVAIEELALASVPHDDREDLARRLNTAADVMEGFMDSPAEAQEADDAWHRLLVEPAGNRRLEVVLERIKQSIRRAEYQLMSSRAIVLRSVGQHRAIADALALGDMERASDVLDHNWRDGLRETLQYLEPSACDSMVAFEALEPTKK
jgi:DNA-binding GntR family transcriptional regulator